MGAIARLRTKSIDRQMAGVLIVALTLRLLVAIVVLLHYPPDWLFSRGLEMGLVARSLLAGHGFASPFGVETGPTALIAPAYPLLVAAVFHAFGVGSPASAAVILLLHTAAAVVTVWLVMRIAGRLGGRRAALTAGLIWAVAPPLLLVPTIFWDTSLSVMALTAMLAAVLHFEAARPTAPWALLGVALALAGLLNPALLPPLGCMLLWLCWRRREGWGLFLAALAFSVIFAAWPARNMRVFGAFIPLRTTTGYELWMGNRPGATGFLDQSLFPSFNAAELEDYRGRGELGYTRHKAALARRYIRTHPGSFARLTSVRVWRFWSGTGSQGGSQIFFFYAGATALLGGMGLWRLVRQGRGALATLFALPVLVFPLPYYITHAEFRYRLVVDPLLTILSGYAVATVIRRLALRSGEEQRGAAADGDGDAVRQAEGAGVMQI